MTPAYQRCWTLGGVVYLLGLLIVLVVGGLRADEANQVAVADGTAPLSVPVPGGQARQNAGSMDSVIVSRVLAMMWSRWEYSTSIGRCSCKLLLFSGCRIMWRMSLPLSLPCDAPHGRKSDGFLGNA